MVSKWFQAEAWQLRTKALASEKSSYSILTKLIKLEVVVLSYYKFTKKYKIYAEDLVVETFKFFLAFGSFLFFNWNRTQDFVSLYIQLPEAAFSKLRHGCSLLNLLHIFRTPFPKNTSGPLLLNFTIHIRCVSKSRAKFN